MASKNAMDGKQRGQARATSKKNKPEQQIRRTNQNNKPKQQPDILPTQTQKPPKDKKTQ